MLFIAFHALAFIIMVNESTGCFKYCGSFIMRKCEDMLDEDGFWKVDHSSLSLEDRQRYCKKYTVSGGRRVEDCKRKNEDRTTWRGKVEVKFFMNNLSLVGSVT